ncbi:uncharacterized protein LOC111010526 [Momordica charantia]|uniref:Uncharacterized protein LOC111010526 n=1 Tax=Momordica charantia TaxID=3673 RepID=A0A6J1CG88_MOMCH|nr:uncharacterized protein LOC111010526 [Momordica charantia]
MGNCLRRDGAAERWAGEEWGFLAEEKQGSAAAPTAAATEVKIKITKKQLEELLGKADVKGLSVQQVLAQLIAVGDQFHESRHRPWRPVLQSIPEMD